MEDRRILAIGAHAGDMEISCGAVLIKEAKLGAEVHLLHLSLGERGYPRKSPQDYGAQKEEEARAYGRKTGVRVHFLRYPDGEVLDCRESRLAVAEKIRQIRPSVVIAHWRASLHPDHTAAHHLSEVAVLWAALEDLGEGPVWRGMRKLFFAENWEDPEGFDPYLYVDATEYREAWHDAAEAYELFRGGVSSFDYMGYYDALGKVRGTQVGVGWAQAFGVWPWAQRQRAALLTG